MTDKKQLNSTLTQTLAGAKLESSSACPVVEIYVKEPSSIRYGKEHTGSVTIYISREDLLKLNQSGNVCFDMQITDTPPPPPPNGSNLSTLFASLHARPIQ
jgi:hypothetical protein